MKYPFLLSLPLLLLLSFLSPTTQFHFRMNYQQRKCFYDEFFSEILLIIRYEVINTFSFIQPETNDKFSIDIKNLDTNQVEQVFFGRKFNEKFSFHLNTPAKIEVCVTSIYKEWYKDVAGPINLKLSIDTSEDEVDVENTVKNKDLDKVKTNLEKIGQLIDRVEKMQTLNSNSETTFANSQKENSDLLMKITIIQIILVVCFGIFQYFSLRSFFKEKNSVL